MHSSHFDDPNGGNPWAFHHNGDPLPGEVLINQYGEGYSPNWPQFRTTVEEIVTFVAAHKMKAHHGSIALRTTVFLPNSDGIIELFAMAPELEWTAVRAEKFLIPYECLEKFVLSVLRRKFDYLLENYRVDESLAGLGLVMSLFISLKD